MAVSCQRWNSSSSTRSLRSARTRNARLPETFNWSSTRVHSSTGSDCACRYDYVVDFFLIRELRTFCVFASSLSLITQLTSCAVVYPLFICRFTHFTYLPIPSPVSTLTGECGRDSSGVHASLRGRNLPQRSRRNGQSWYIVAFMKEKYEFYVV